MLVSSTPETTNPVSDQCEREKPCISTVAPWQPFGRGGEPGVGFDHAYHFFWASRTSSVTQPFSRRTVVQRLLTLIPNDEIARNSYFELHFVACAGHE